MQELTLATLLSSRLCHDLVSPVGAIHNGLEIIEDEADREMVEHAQSLIRQSAKAASSKLQFYRIAFGMAGSLGEVVPLSEVYNLSRKLIDGHKIDINWQCANTDLLKDQVRLLLNLILIASEALPRGGILHIGVRKEGAVNLMVQAEGPKMLLSEKSREILRDGYDIHDLQPKEANLYLTHRLASSLNADIFCDKSEACIELSATI